MRLINILKNKLDKKKMKNCNKSTILKLIYLVAQDEDNLINKLTNQIEEARNEELEYIIISLQSILNELDEARYLEKIVNIYYSLYKYNDFDILFITSELNENELTAVLNTIQNNNPSVIFARTDVNNRQVKLELKEGIGDLKTANRLKTLIKKGAVLKLMK